MVSTTTKYALRAMAHLARLPQATSILGRDLAEQARIPANYLSKVLLQLRNARLVEAARGYGGGYRLAKPPAEIPLIDVVRLFEGVHSEPGCLLGEQDICSDDNPCSAHAEWKKVRAVYLDFLMSKTIADVSRRAEPDRQQRCKRSTATANRWGR